MLTAPADAALREAGGRESCADPSDSDDGASIEIGIGGCRIGPRSRSSGAGVGRGGSGAGLLAKVNIEFCLSCEAALILALGGGGGGKAWFKDGSGDDLY